MSHESVSSKAIESVRKVISQYQSSKDGLSALLAVLNEFANDTGFINNPDQFDMVKREINDRLSGLNKQ